MGVGRQSFKVVREGKTVDSLCGISRRDITGTCPCGIYNFNAYVGTLPVNRSHNTGRPPEASSRARPPQTGRVDLLAEPGVVSESAPGRAEQHQPSPVVHCPAALMNVGWIEATKGDFYFYAQGMSPSVSRVTEKVDEERLTIARAYGLDLVSITTYMNQNYQHDREFGDYHEFAVGSVIRNKTKSAPMTMKHRYQLEDILYGMVPWYELGLTCGLASPTIRSLIEMASVVSGFDSVEHGRTLKAAGLGEATKEQVLFALGGSVDKTPSIISSLSDAPVNEMLESHAPLQTFQLAV